MYRLSACNIFVVITMANIVFCCCSRQKVFFPTMNRNRNLTTANDMPPLAYILITPNVGNPRENDWSRCRYHASWVDLSYSIQVVLKEDKVNTNGDDQNKDTLIRLYAVLSHICFNNESLNAICMIVNKLIVSCVKFQTTQKH